MKKVFSWSYGNSGSHKNIYQFENAIKSLFTNYKYALESTLDSGINVPPGITVAHPLKNFHITILIIFYINLGIVVIFKFFLSSKVLKN